MEYKIMLIEDDRGIASAVGELAESWGMKTCTVKDFRNVMAEFTAFQPHLVVLDLFLPFFNGYHWCQEIRRVSKVPIIIISSASDNLNIIMAMNMGADDFISKPFDGSVLIAKIRALLRRSYDFAESKMLLEHKGAIFSPDDGVVSYNGEQIRLTKNEHIIMLNLMKNKNKVVSREKLMEALWQTDNFVDDNTLTVNVNRLRKKLENAGLNDFISTRFGVGYIIEE